MLQALKGEEPFMILMAIIPFDNRILFILLAAGILALFIFFLKKLMKYREKKKEITTAAQDRMRDDNLNHIILNSYSDKDKNKEVYMPYEVDYGSQDKNGKKKENRADTFDGGHGELMLQLIEKTELSTRKFVLNPAKGIRIGSDMQDNDIPVVSKGVAPHQCEIFAAGGRVYIRNMGEGNRTLIKRKKERAIVDHKGIRLLSGDSILVGSISYDITIIK